MKLKKGSFCPLRAPFLVKLIAVNQSKTKKLPCNASLLAYVAAGVIDTLSRYGTYQPALVK